ncbi:hypothetical protein NXS19_003195 [Fusarium pseudograminearum]|nr:hypothetical protein NXS19_003195 [Fusarium pseudograminearum]
MKFTVLIAAALAAAPIPEAAAHPGMGETIKEIERIAARSWGNGWGSNKWPSKNTGGNTWSSGGGQSSGGNAWGNGGGQSGGDQGNGDDSWSDSGSQSGGNSWSNGQSQNNGGGSSSWPGQSNGGSSWSSGGGQSGGQGGWTGDSFNAHSLIGDLSTVSDKSLTSVGRDIKKILQGNGNPTSRERYFGCPSMNTPQCKRDTCCVWQYISNELQERFRGEAGRCTRWARYAVRIGFHDAGTWSLKTASQGGGADGSIILANELTRGENKGLEQIGAYYQTIYDKYHNSYGFTQVTMADLIQMGSNIAAVTCPLGPRVRSFVGRKDSTKANLGDSYPRSPLMLSLSSTCSRTRPLARMISSLSLVRTQLLNSTTPTSTVMVIPRTAPLVSGIFSSTSRLSTRTPPSVSTSSLVTRFSPNTLSPSLPLKPLPAVAAARLPGTRITPAPTSVSVFWASTISTALPNAQRFFLNPSSLTATRTRVDSTSGFRVTTTHTHPRLFPRISTMVMKSLFLRTRSLPDVVPGRSGPLCSSGGKHFCISFQQPFGSWWLLKILDIVSQEMVFCIYDSARETGLSVHQSMPLGMI